MDHLCLHKQSAFPPLMSFVLTTALQGRTGIYPAQKRTHKSGNAASRPGSVSWTLGPVGENLEGRGGFEIQNLKYRNSDSFPKVYITSLML